MFRFGMSRFVHRQVPMPHAFKAHRAIPSSMTLIRLHADVGGKIKQNERQAELAEQAAHIEAVICMFDPGFTPLCTSAGLTSA
jgi:hypothetical protein